MKLFDDAQPVALVTGAGRGIGRAIALELAHEGAAVVVNYRQSEGEAKELVEEIADAGHTATLVQADVADEAAVRAMFRQVHRQHGRLDVLVNNAGITQDGFTAMMSAKKWGDVLRTNLDGAFFCTREAVKLMMRGRRGSIVNVASMSGVAGWPGQANYSASKGGLIALTKAVAKEVGGFGIRLNAVAPGLIDTDMAAALGPGMGDLYAAMVPLQRTGTPEDVAHLVAFLASDRASFITGKVISIDGGFLAA